MDLYHIPTVISSQVTETNFLEQLLDILPVGICRSSNPLRDQTSPQMETIPGTPRHLNYGANIFPTQFQSNHAIFLPR